MQVSDGGVPKLPVASARVTPAGLEGDRQRHLEFHGGPDRALCLFSLEVIERLRAEGHAIAPGSVGENLTIAGVEWSALAPPARVRVGEEVELEITSFTQPCRTIAASFADGRFARISQKHHPGESRVYARVIRAGVVRPGDAVEVVAAEHRGG